MKIIYGTGNKGKLEQVKEYLLYKMPEIEIVSMKDIGFDEEIEENGTTFEENSMIKAKAIKAFCNRNHIEEYIMTDDAGLCIDALNGEPGIYSARYAGDHAPQEVCIKKVLDNMKGIPEGKRTATFVCVLTMILPSGEVLIARGETKGKIALQPGPLGKTTYGPIFMPEGFEKTMNEMTIEELGSTHREKALMELIEKLKQRK